MRPQAGYALVIADILLDARDDLRQREWAELLEHLIGLVGELLANTRSEDLAEAA